MGNKEPASQSGFKVEDIINFFLLKKRKMVHVHMLGVLQVLVFSLQVMYIEGPGDYAIGKTWVEFL